MISLTLAIVVVLVIGYLYTAIEGVTKANKAAVTLLMSAFCQTSFMLGPNAYIPGATGQNLIDQVSYVIEKHLGSTSTTLFFLMGAVAIVGVVDQNGGFNFVRDVMKTKNKRTLLWRITFMAFVLFVTLDNLTTSIVMIMVLCKLVHSYEDRLIYAPLVIISASADGAFSPIGDVTTTMLWSKGVITVLGVMEEIFLPSVMTMVVPAFTMQYSLKGELEMAEANMKSGYHVLDFTKRQCKVIFIADVSGLMFVPISESLTHLPPFVGVLLVLGALWTATRVFCRGLDHKRDGTGKRVSKLLSNIDMSTIPFFLDILMAMACLEGIGVLGDLGAWLNDASGDNHYVVTGVIGVISSIVDNAPLATGCMGVYSLEAVNNVTIDGILWQLLAYYAGVGGSVFIVDSTTGMVVMGLERITLGWYMKHVSWLAFVDYLAGILNYWIVRSFIIPIP